MTNETLLIVQRLVGRALSDAQAKLETCDIERVEWHIANRDKMFRSALEVGADTAFVVERSKRTADRIPQMRAIAIKAA